MAQHALDSGHGAGPGSHDEHLAVYRAGIHLHLRLVALQLAQKSGRIPANAAPENLLDLDDGALQTSTAQGLEQITGELPDSHTEASVHEHPVPEFSPLPLRGGQARRGRAPPTSLLVQNLVLDHPPLLRGILAASHLAAGDQSPARTLSCTYESLLAYAPAGTPRFSLAKSTAHMKRHGSFYTRPALARLVVEAALLPVYDRLSDRVSPLRVLDPAMGTGVFLLEAVNALVSAGAGSAAQVAESSVYGYDLDELAVEVAVLSLWLETGARRHILVQHLRRLDPVRSVTGADGAGFDLVIGNPPWGATYAPAEQKALADRWRLSSSGSFDSFKLFLELAAEQSDGTIGMIVPRAVLSQSTHSGVRELLLQRFAPYEVRTLDAAEFPRAVAPACSLILGPRPGPATITTRTGPIGSRDQKAEHRIPAHLWTRDRFPLCNEALLEMLERLGLHHPRIGDLAGHYRVRDAGINYNRAAIARRILYEGHVAEHPEDLPRYRGRNFARYGAVEQGGWLRHDAHRRLQSGDQLYLSHETYRLPEKIVFRQTADRITATLDRTRMAMGRSVIVVIAAANAPLLPLLACLNSRILTSFYRALSGEEGRVLPQVKVKSISMLPLPSACLDGNRNPAWLELGQMASTALARGGDDTLDLEIDHAVCRLFGLSAPETATIVTA